MSVLAEHAGRADVLIRRGVTTRWGIRWEHSTDGRTYYPVDLSSWSAELILRSPGGEIWLRRPVPSDTSGLALIALEPTETGAEVWATRAGGQWQVDATAPDGRIERLADGYFYLEA